VGAGARDSAPAAPSTWDEQGGEAEALVEDLLARLPPEKRQALDPQLAPSKSLLDAVPVVLQHGPVKEAGASVAPPSVTSRPDPAHTAVDERRLRALLAAFRGRVPGPIGDALDREPEKP